jgi:hypothetical protein
VRKRRRGGAARLPAGGSVGRPAPFDFRWRPVAHDANDDAVLETANNGSANVIATFNVKDIAAGARTFGIPAERPAQVLGRIRG